MLDAGFDGVQTKPIHVLEFLKSVEETLQRKAAKP